MAESELIWVYRRHTEPPSYTPLIQEPGHQKGRNPNSAANPRRTLTGDHLGRQGQHRAAAVQMFTLGHGARRLLSSRGLWPEPRVLNLTAQHRPGWWVVTWDSTCEGATLTVRTTKDILPKLRVHRELGAGPDSTGATTSRCHCGSPTWLSFRARQAPGGLVKMHILIQGSGMGPGILGF